jgi:hypothetical protein
MWVLMKNLIHRGVRQLHHQPVMDSSCNDFLVTHPLTFTEATDSLEVDIWLCIIKSKFELLHYTEF